MERAFEARDVFGVVKDMNGDKAPGPDIFFYGFFSKIARMSKSML